MTLEQAHEYVLARLGISSGESGVLEALVDRQLDQEYQRTVMVHRLVVERTDLVLTAGDPVVDLPDDLNEILTLSAGGRPLQELSWPEYVELVSGTLSDTSAVAFYTPSGTSAVRVHPEPSENDNAGISLWYSAAASSWTGVDGAGTSESPDALPSAFHDLPCERAVAFLALIDEALDLAAAATARAENLETMLVRHLGRRAGMAGDTITVRGLS